MKTKKKWFTRKNGSLALGAVILCLVTTAGSCGDNGGNTSASCSFVVGDGDGDHDARVHHVYLPNDNIHYDESSEIVRYVPCNARNFIINDGTIRNANNQVVGDRDTPTVAYTTTNVKMKIMSTTAWTLNQSTNAMINFWTFCFKYTCASSKDTAGTANFSTPGWNGMLGENFNPTIDASIQEAAKQFGDELWQDHDRHVFDKLSKAASNIFKDRVRQLNGYSTDLFCGSGNSQWDSKRKNFTCSAVRIIINDVQAADASLQQTASKETQAEQDKKANAKRLDAAKELYGDDASGWLGLQDTIEKCKAAGSTCIINLGGSNVSPAVPVPTGNGN
jgi:hypothetical protein